MAYVESCVEGGYERNDVQNETDVTADNTKLSLEWQFVQSMSLYHPTAAEADMGETYATPDEEVGKTGER